MRIYFQISRVLTLVAVLFTAAVVGAWTSHAATITGASDTPSTLEASQAANHTLLFTTPSGVSEGDTITVTFSSEFDTSSITEDDVDVSDDDVDLTTASDCSGSEQASVAIAADVLTITICAGDGGAMAASSQIGIEIGTNATSSGTGSNQVTNPSSSGNYYVSVAGGFGDSGSIIIPIGSDDSISVTATVPPSGGSGESGSGGGGAPRSSAPRISNILVTNITTSSATISWNTDKPGESLVSYWTGDEEPSIATKSGYFTSHSFDLTGLREATLYEFYVVSADSDGRAGTSFIQSFTTLDETLPIISDLEVTDITSSSVRIIWNTNEETDSLVLFGETSAYERKVTDEEFELAHSIILTDLQPATTYHYQVVSEDRSANQAASSDRTFTTDYDSPPGNVSNVSVSEGDTELFLRWDNPSDEDLSGILVLRCLSTYPVGPTDTSCVTISTDIRTSYTDEGLENGTTYYYGLFAYDALGQFASGALVLGTPKASEEEVPSPEESEPSEGQEADSSDDTPSEGDPSGQEENSDAEPSDSQESAVSCGDDICSESESSLSCPIDCGEADEPTSLGAEEGQINSTDLLYFVANQSIALQATRSGVVDVLPTSTLRIALDATLFPDGIQSIYLSIDSDLYLMRLDDALALYLADITTPEESSLFEVDVLITSIDESTDSVSSYLRVLPKGYTYQVVDGEEAVVTSATVTLFEQVGDTFEVWDGSPYDQFNPTQIGGDGSFAWYVPNGTYWVQVSAEGFGASGSGSLNVQNAIVNPSLLLVAEEDNEQPIAEEPEEDSETFISTTPSVVEGVQSTLEVIRELPGVEEAAEISVPTLTLMAGASVVVLSVAFDFLPFLQYIFTAPILFFRRLRRKGYGVVYNAISKTPVDLAVVRLFKVDDETANARGRLVKSQVTDKGGRYFFLVPPGRYRIQVTKPGFDFPTQYLKDEKTDGAFLDVYHGEEVQVKEDGVVVTANIPLDPSQSEKYQAPSSVRRRAVLRRIQQGLAVVGILAAVVFAIIRPTIFSISMVGIQGIVYLLARRLAIPQKPISWGIVYDQDTGRPISRVVARIFEPKYNKLLETQVTDSKGRYAFILGPNNYYATFQKPGFKQVQIDPIDYSTLEEPKEFSAEVALQPVDEQKK